MSARDAYKKGDVKASILYHNTQRMNSQEHHGGEAAEYLKSIVYGGLDGIITTFATVTSTAGAELSAAVIVILGISHLFADGLSMGKQMTNRRTTQHTLNGNLSPLLSLLCTPLFSLVFFSFFVLFFAFLCLLRNGRCDVFPS